MMDFSFVTSRLSTGAAISSESDVVALVASGITHVVDCRLEYDDGALLRSHPNIQYIWNPTDDDGEVKPPEWFKRSLDFALPNLAMPGNKIYCHCAAGVNRGPSTLYAILRSLGLTRAFCESLIWTHRPVTLVGIRYKDDADAAIKVLGYE